MKKDEIRYWLISQKRDRAWLAAQIGVSKGTIDQWFSKGFPDWAQKSIARLMNPLQHKASGLELVFTHDEWMEITQAMKIIGHVRHSDFYHYAITEKAAEIIAANRLSLES